MKTTDKIERVIQTNFQKKEMNTLWISKISNTKNIYFYDVFYALAEHKKNNDNIKFAEKINKTAQALNIPIQTFAPFMIKYFIIRVAYNTNTTKHIEKLSQLAKDNQLEEKTNIRDVIARKNIPNKNRLSLTDDKKTILDAELEKIDFSNNKINFIELINKLNY